MKPPRFSARTAWDTADSPLTQAIEEARAEGRLLVDLSLANPTRCGFQYDPHLLEALVQPAALVYDPAPLGISFARAAVAEYYRDHQAEVALNQLLLTTSTSEAYSFLFRLLCDPGDQILVAQPSYPLFDFLAALDHVELTPYPLFYDYGWWIDFATLEQRIGPRTRAILLVHPNNPTGHFTSTQERLQLEQICASHGLALIVDEVFLDYSQDQTPPFSFARGPHPALTFVISGLSKIAALPQMKVGWLAGFGPELLLAECMSRLEIIADTFLSMNAPAQHALPTWLAGREGMVQQIRERCRANLEIWRESAFEPLPVQAGWSACLRLPAWLDSRPETLVRDAGIIVHSGEFYSLPGSGWIVVSLIVESSVCRQGVQRLREWITLTTETDCSPVPPRSSSPDHAPE